MPFNTPMLVIQRERERRRSSSAYATTSTAASSGLSECEKLAARLDEVSRHAHAAGARDTSSARQGVALLSLAQAIKAAAATTVSAEARQRLRLKAAAWIGSERVALAALIHLGERLACRSVEILARSRVAGCLSGELAEHVSASLAEAAASASSSNLGTDDDVAKEALLAVFKSCVAEDASSWHVQRLILRAALAVSDARLLHASALAIAAGRRRRARDHVTDTDEQLERTDENVEVDEMGACVLEISLAKIIGNALHDESDGESDDLLVAASLELAAVVASGGPNAVAVLTRSHERRHLLSEFLFRNLRPHNRVEGNEDEDEEDASVSRTVSLCITTASYVFQNVLLGGAEAETLSFAIADQLERSSNVQAWRLALEDLVRIMSVALEEEDQEDSHPLNIIFEIGWIGRDLASMIVDQLAARTLAKEDQVVAWKALELLAAFCDFVEAWPFASFSQ